MGHSKLLNILTEMKYNRSGPQATNSVGVCQFLMTKLVQGFWYFAEKKAKFRGIFRGKFAEKSADFAGFSREKSQNSLKNRPISRDFRWRKVKIRRKIGRFRGILAEKKSIFEGFSGANSQKNRPISREISGGNFAKKQSVKNSRFRWVFFGKFR